jgi:hypothetical protein
VRPYSSGTGISVLICARRLLVLVSQGRQPTTTSLSTSALTPSQGELAVQHLLNVVRSGVTGTRLSGQRGAYATRTLSFLSGNVPRDRRGRIAHRPGSLSLDETGSDFEDDVVTPRLGLGASAGAGARERERELLESLRSPDPSETRQSVGGWGLGAWDEGVSAREKDDDDEDEQVDLEQIQVSFPQFPYMGSPLMYGTRLRESDDFVSSSGHSA